MNTKLTTKKRNAMVQANMGLAHHFVKKFRATGMEFDDLLQEAYMGLVDAAENFDPNHGTKFSTYAYWHITKRVMDAIHKNGIVRTPRRRPALRLGSFDGDVPEPIDSGDSPSDQLEQAETVDLVRECIKDLPAREAIVIRLRHGVNTERMTLEKISAIMGVSRERVRQIQNSAEEKLRQLVIQRGILAQHGSLSADDRANDPADSIED